MLSSQIPQLYIHKTDKGRGVYTALDIGKGSIIEVCPVLILEDKDRVAIHETVLHDYYFMWNMESGSCAIALGYGSLYNHSDEPNAEFLIDPAREELKIRSLQRIDAGEEISVRYIAKGERRFELWFDET